MGTLTKGLTTPPSPQWLGWHAKDGGCGECCLVCKMSHIVNIEHPPTPLGIGNFGFRQDLDSVSKVGMTPYLSPLPPPPDDDMEFALPYTETYLPGRLTFRFYFHLLLHTFIL